MDHEDSGQAVVEDLEAEASQAAVVAMGDSAVGEVPWEEDSVADNGSVIAGATLAAGVDSEEA